MPVIGNTMETPRMPGSGYANDPMAAYAKEFLNLSNSILEEGRLDIFTEPSKVFRRNVTDEKSKLLLISPIRMNTNTLFITVSRVLVF